VTIPLAGYKFHFRLEQEVSLFLKISIPAPGPTLILIQMVPAATFPWGWSHKRMSTSMHYFTVRIVKFLFLFLHCKTYRMRHTSKWEVSLKKMKNQLHSEKRT